MCDAVVRHLEKWTGESRSDIRHPETEGVGPPVELSLQLGDQHYAIEHTRIEAFDNQIKAGISIREIDNYIKKWFTEPLPGPAYYELQVPLDVCLPAKRKERERLLSSLGDWIQESAHCMQERNTDLFTPIRSKVWHEDCVIGRHLPALLDGRKDAPDDIYLVSPSDSLWWVLPVKHDDDHWPDMGMPLPGQAIYDEDKLPTAGMPKWYRDALGLDKIILAIRKPGAVSPA